MGNLLRSEEKVSEQSEEKERQKSGEVRRDEVLRMLDRKFALINQDHPAMRLLRREAERHWLHAIEEEDG